MAIAQRGLGRNPSRRVACLRFLYPLIALDDAHVMGGHDPDIARQEFAMPEIVVFEDGEMCAADVRSSRKGLPDVSRRTQAHFVRPMNKAPVTEDVQHARVRSPLPSSRTDRPPVDQVWASRLSSARCNSPERLKVGTLTSTRGADSFMVHTDSTSATRSSARLAWIAI